MKAAEMKKQTETLQSWRQMLLVYSRAVLKVSVLHCIFNIFTHAILYCIILDKR